MHLLRPLLKVANSMNMIVHPSSRFLCTAELHEVFVHADAHKFVNHFWLQDPLNLETNFFIPDRAG